MFRNFFKLLFFNKVIGMLRYKFPFLYDNRLWGGIRLYYKYFIYFNTYPRYQINQNAEIFYSENAERLNKVKNTFADEKSKEIYLGIIKYRQTGHKKDFPFHAVKEAQYFIKELKFNKDEFFIDCGAFIGDVIDIFIRHCKNKYKQIIAFEPALKNFERLKTKYGNKSKITLISAGVYDKNGEVFFTGGGGGTY